MLFYVRLISAVSYLSLIALCAPTLKKQDADQMFDVNTEYVPKESLRVQVGDDVTDEEPLTSHTSAEQYIPEKNGLKKVTISKDTKQSPDGHALEQEMTIQEVSHHGLSDDLAPLELETLSEPKVLDNTVNRIASELSHVFQENRNDPEIDRWFKSIFPDVFSTDLASILPAENAGQETEAPNVIPNPPPPHNPMAGRPKRSLQESVFTAEDMMESRDSMHAHERSKRDLREDDPMYWTDDQGDDYTTLANDYYESYPESYGAYDYDSDAYAQELAEEELLRDLEYERQEYPLPGKESNDILERLAYLDSLYDDQVDDPEQRWEEEQRLEQQPTYVYPKLSDTFQTSKRQFLSLVPGNRKRSSYEPSGRWGALVDDEIEKRNENVMYERLLRMAELLRGPRISDYELKKKK